MTLFCLLVLAATSRAGSRYNSNTGTRDFCNTIRSESGDVVSDRCEPLRIAGDALTDEGSFFLLRAGSATGNYTSLTTSDADASIAFSLIRKAIASSADAGFETGTLPDGKSGQVLVIEITEVGEGGSWTLTPDTATGFVSLRFEAPGDRAALLFVDITTGWIRLTTESVQEG